ncbi:single-stranded DNA-binding protein [Nocardioides sp. SYSU D00038]|uniref:single-stranded DNA-binding protein n=1 Tax=Nocardioides sp. SYSU D00038 TaxID=2812554 RepID=UPI001967C8F7|nr:single-stranded DNA-binding protein [Nocardioides sp. SYSU D00038]
MNETLVTLQGWLGSDVDVRSVGETTVASFRVGCTPRRYSRRTESWGDADTQWYRVNAWRQLAEHCADSLRRGDPVVVHGKMSARTFVDKAGVEVSVLEVEAWSVGHDLNRGVSRFTKTARPVESPAPSVTSETSADAREEVTAA